MSRISPTPGDKDRISANAGRIYVSALDNGLSTTEALKLAVDGALAIEEAVTEALCPTDIEGD